jgi:DNA-binding transcriptional MerR regulator
MSIGDLSKSTGVKVVTIRYYEQADLMPHPPRTGGNYRTYNSGDVRRLQFIRRLRDLGFTLDEVRDLLRLSSEKNQPCDEVDRITREHLATVEMKLRDLEKLASELRELSRRCRGGGRIAECQIVEALSPGSQISTRRKRPGIKPGRDQSGSRTW